MLNRQCLASSQSATNRFKEGRSFLRSFIKPLSGTLIFKANQLIESPLMINDRAQWIRSFWTISDRHCDSTGPISFKMKIWAGHSLPVCEHTMSRKSMTLSAEVKQALDFKGRRRPDGPMAFTSDTHQMGALVVCRLPHLVPFDRTETVDRKLKSTWFNPALQILHFRIPAKYVRH